MKHGKNLLSSIYKIDLSAFKGKPWGFFSLLFGWMKILNFLDGTRGPDIQVIMHTYSA